MKKNNLQQEKYQLIKYRETPLGEFSVQERNRNKIKPFEQKIIKPKVEQSQSKEPVKLYPLMPKIRLLPRNSVLAEHVPTHQNLQSHATNFKLQLFPRGMMVLGLAQPAKRLGPVTPSHFEALQRNKSLASGSISNLIEHVAGNSGKTDPQGNNGSINSGRKEHQG